MEETKESLTFKGVAERLTLGITRILGVYHDLCPEPSQKMDRLACRYTVVEHGW